MDGNQAVVHRTLEDILPVPEQFLHEFTPQDLDELRETFVEVDKDSSGTIDISELASVFAALGETVSPEQMDDLMREIDLDGSGEIDFGEFLGMIVNVRRHPERFKGFTSLLSALGDTPMSMLQYLADNRHLKLEYRLAELRPATASRGEVYVMAAQLTGLWTEDVDGKVHQVRETRSYQGIGNTTRVARRKAAQAALEKLKGFIPGLEFRPGVLPPEWQAWAEENLDRGVNPLEILSILKKKGFTPAKNERFMQFLSASMKMTVTTTLPREVTGYGVSDGSRLAMIEAGGDGLPPQDSVAAGDSMWSTGTYDTAAESLTSDRPAGMRHPAGLTTTATIIGSLTSSSKLPPQWVAWLRDNLARGVNGKLLLEILIKHGFEPRENPIVVQALLQTDKQPSHVDRAERRRKAAEERNEVAAFEDAAAADEARKLRMLDFASIRAVVIPDDIEAEKDELGKKAERGVEKKMAFANHSDDVRTYGDNLSVGRNWDARRPTVALSRAPGRHTTTANHKLAELGLGTGIKKLARDKERSIKAKLPTAGATQNLTSTTGVGPDDEGEEGATYWGAILRGDIDEVRLYLTGGQDPTQPSPIKRVPPVVIAVLHRRMEILRLLVTHGCSVNTCDTRYRTALHYACGGGELEFVEFLVTNGANIFAGDTYGDTPIHVAANRGFSQILDWLYSYVEERLLRHCVEWQFVEYVKDLYKRMIKERVGRFGTQHFQRAWLWEAYKRVYDDAHAVHQFFMPKPFKDALIAAQRRFLTDPTVTVLDVDQLQYILAKTFVLSITIVPNKAGRRPLHMAVDPPVYTMSAGHVACVKVLVDAFAADVETKDNAGRTAMATLAARNKANRPGFGPHAARKLAILESLQAKSSSPRMEAESTVKLPPLPSPAKSASSPSVGEEGSSPSRLAVTTADRSNVAMAGMQAEAMRILRVAGSRFAEGMRACEWGCRQWIKRGLQERHAQTTCVRRISPCKFKCGIAIREEQWEIIRERHYAEECARRPVPCSLGCGGTFPEEDIPLHQLRTCVKRQAKPISCPLKCGLKFRGTYDRVRDIEREVAEHVKEHCPKRLVHCDFTGCYDEMRAEERRDHRARHLRDMGIFQWTTPGKYNFVVPRMVTELKVHVWGAGGGGGQFKNVKGGHGGGGAYLETVLPVAPGDELIIVVGSGGDAGKHGVTAVPVNEILKRPEIKQKTGVAEGGMPGGGKGYAANSTFAAGGGGGYSAVYSKVEDGTEVMALAGGGGGGGTRDGRPGGLAYVVSRSGEAPDEGHGGKSEDEVSASESEEEDLGTWLDRLKDRKGAKKRTGETEEDNWWDGKPAGDATAPNWWETAEWEGYGDDQYGYFDEYGEWHWYEHEGYYDDTWTWNWYQDVGYYAADGSWVWNDDAPAAADTTALAGAGDPASRAHSRRVSEAQSRRASAVEKGIRIRRISQASQATRGTRRSSARVSNASQRTYQTSTTATSALFKVPGGRAPPDLRSIKERMEDEKQARLLTQALRKSKITPDGDDLLRTGRSGGVKAGGKPGYQGGKPGEPLQGGDGSTVFGAGGGGGMYGGGGGGNTPGMVGGGGGGSSYSKAKPGVDPLFQVGTGRQPGGMDKYPPEATLAGEWDKLGGPVGQGGVGTKEDLSNGLSGCVRIRLPGYYDVVMDDTYTLPPHALDEGYDGMHPAGVRPDKAALDAIQDKLSAPKFVADL